LQKKKEKENIYIQVTQRKKGRLKERIRKRERERKGERKSGK